MHILVDFEKIVEEMPIAVTIWRIESEARSEASFHDFRLLYANSKSSIEANIDLFDSIGYKLDSITPSKLPTMPDVWLRTLINKKIEIVEKEYLNQVFEIKVIPLDDSCVANLYRNVTAEIKTADSTNKSLINLKKVETELMEFKKRKSENSK